MDDIELPDTPASPESFNGLVDEKKNERRRGEQ